MYHYEAYGLTIASEIELDARPTNSDAPDVFIRILPPPADGKLGTYTPDCVIGSVRDRMMFRVTAGREVDLIPNPKYREDAPDVLRLVLNLILAIVLQQRGCLILHAATLRLDDQCVAFMGDCGSGKSTTAAYLHQHGFALVDDDLLVVDPHTTPPTVIPGNPRIKLRPTSADLVGDRFDTLPLVHPYETKRLLELDLDRQSALPPLTSLFILKWSEDGRAAINRPVNGIETMKYLLTNSFIAKLDILPEQRRINFERCDALLKQVDVFEIERPQSLDSLPMMRDLLLDHLSQVGDVKSSTS
jgi:hypothetical protein